MRGRVRRIGTNNRALRRLIHLLVLPIEIGRSRDFAGRVDLDLPHIAERTNLTFSGLLCNGNHCGERAGFCTHFPAKSFTEPAVEATGPAVVRFGENRHRSREWMPAELASCALE